MDNHNPRRGAREKKPTSKVKQCNSCHLVSTLGVGLQMVGGEWLCGACKARKEAEFEQDYATLVADLAAEGGSQEYGAVENFKTWPSSVAFPDPAPHTAPLGPAAAAALAGGGPGDCFYCTDGTCGHCTPDEQQNDGDIDSETEKEMQGLGFDFSKKQLSPDPVIFKFMF